MNYPFMLIMRNSSEGMIWQAYTVYNDEERDTLTYNAHRNGFVVQQEELGYAKETTPGWRYSEEWKSCRKVSKI